MYSGWMCYGATSLAYPTVASRFPDISYANAGMSLTPVTSIHAL